MAVAEPRFEFEQRADCVAEAVGLSTAIYVKTTKGPSARCICCLCPVSALMCLASTLWSDKTVTAVALTQ